MKDDNNVKLSEQDSNISSEHKYIGLPMPKHITFGGFPSTSKTKWDYISWLLVRLVYELMRWYVWSVSIRSAIEGVTSILVNVFGK